MRLTLLLGITLPFGVNQRRSPATRHWGLLRHSRSSKGGDARMTLDYLLPHLLRPKSYSRVLP